MEANSNDQVDGSATGSGGRQVGANTRQNKRHIQQGLHASQAKKDRRATMRGGAPGGVTSHPDGSSITSSLSTRREADATTWYRRRNNRPCRKRLVNVTGFIAGTTLLESMALLLGRRVDAIRIERQAADFRLPSHSVPCHAAAISSR